MIMPPHGADTSALWTVHTYLLDIFTITPRLQIRAPDQEADIRAIFAERKASFIDSQGLVDELVKLEGRPWAEYGRSQKPITKNRLARLLPRGVAPEHDTTGDQRGIGSSASRKPSNAISTAILPVATVRTSEMPMAQVFLTLARPSERIWRLTVAQPSETPMTQAFLTF